MTFVEPFPICFETRAKEFEAASPVESASSSSSSSCAADMEPFQSRTPLEEEVSGWALTYKCAIPWWAALHDSYCDMLQEYRENGGLRGGLLWYGASITESLRGLSGGHYEKRCEGIRDVYEEEWMSRVPRQEVLGIAADNTKDLAWRLLHGEGPAGLGASTAIVLIGPNEIPSKLGDDATVEETSADIAGRITAIVQLLLEQDPGLKVVLLGLMPIGTDPDMFKATWPCIERVDARLADFATSPEACERVTYACCGDALLAPSGDRADPLLMADHIHPNCAGWSAMSKKLLPTVMQVMDSNPRN